MEREKTEKELSVEFDLIRKRLLASGVDLSKIVLVGRDTDRKER